MNVYSPFTNTISSYSLNLTVEPSGESTGSATVLFIDMTAETVGSFQDNTSYFFLLRNPQFMTRI